MTCSKFGESSKFGEIYDVTCLVMCHITNFPKFWRWLVTPNVWLINIRNEQNYDDWQLNKKRAKLLMTNNDIRNQQNYNADKDRHCTTYCSGKVCTKKISSMRLSMLGASQPILTCPTRSFSITVFFTRLHYLMLRAFPPRPCMLFQQNVVHYKLHYLGKMEVHNTQGS